MREAPLRQPRDDQQARAGVLPRAREDREKAGAHLMEATIRRLLTVMFTKLQYSDDALAGLSDADVEAGLHLTEEEKSVIEHTASALLEIFRGELEEKIGQAITKIRDGEGIDPDQIDQVLGVEPWDL